MSQRRFQRNSGSRRSTNGQPGQWAPLRATVNTPGTSDVQTIIGCTANQFGCKISASLTGSPLPYLIGRIDDEWKTADASAIVPGGEDGEGSLFSLVFPGVLDTSSQWGLMLPAGWHAVRARDGSPLAGIVSPALGVPTTAPGWIGVDNLIDSPPPPASLPAWIPTDWQIQTFSQLQFLTHPSDPPIAPNPADLVVDGSPADSVTENAPGVYIASSMAWSLNTGSLVTISGGSAGWQTVSGRPLGPVWSRL